MGNRNLRKGMTGPDVKAVQQALNAHNPKNKIAEDAIFGSRETDPAVREYQRKNGLDPDGVVGPLTRASLFPIGVATVAIYGERLQSSALQPLGSRTRHPNVMTGGLHLDYSIVKRFIAMGLVRPMYEPIRLPGLPQPLPAPVVPDLNFVLPRSPHPGRSAPQPLGFEYDHVELVPGGQSTFPFGAVRQDLFIWTIQTVYLRGPDKGPHQEADLGVQFGRPFTALGGHGDPWTYNPFLQLTDVDRFGKLGQFHYWQPYAQAGVQAFSPGTPRPALTGNLFPVNLGIDIGDVLTVQLGAGLAATLDLQTGKVTAGPQLTIGVNVKLGRLRLGWRNPDPAR